MSDLKRQVILLLGGLFLALSAGAAPRGALGDIILEVAGIKLKDNTKTYQRIREKLRRVKSNRTVTLRILRDGRVIELMVKRPW
ncbi:MAG: hypothetical protein ACE5H7_01715 [Acidiferrobacterales bacterium]